MPHKDPEVRRAYYREYDKQRRSIDHQGKKDSHRRRSFRMEPARYQEMLNAQRGVCAICGHPETVVSKNGDVVALAVDHDRRCCPGDLSCGACVRGLLCHACNTGLGKFGDQVDLLFRAIAYVGSFA